MSGLRKNFGIVFCTAALMPWVNFGLNDFDSQPWPIITAFCFLLCLGGAAFVPLNVFIAIFVGTVGFLFSTIATHDVSSFLYVRAVVAYASFFIILLSFYNYLVRFGFPWRVFVLVNLSWLVIACVELFAPQVSEVFSVQRTTVDRGVTSLAPEPTFFAIYLFFNNWLMLGAADFQPSSRIKFLIFLNLLAIVLLAKSTMVVLFIFVLLCLLLWRKLVPLIVRRSEIKFWVFLAVLPIAFGLVAGGTLKGSRLEQILTVLSQRSPADIVVQDASINQRLEAIVLSFHGSIYHRLWPAGLDTYIETRSMIIQHYDDFFWWLSQSNKIMSFLGAFVYELGVFGLISIVFLSAFAYDGGRSSRISLLLLGIILLSAVPIAFPLVPMLIALMGWRKKIRRS